MAKGTRARLGALAPLTVNDGSLMVWVPLWRGGVPLWRGCVVSVTGDCVAGCHCGGVGLLSVASSRCGDWFRGPVAQGRDPLHRSFGCTCLAGWRATKAALAIIIGTIGRGKHNPTSQTWKLRLTLRPSTTLSPHAPDQQRSNRWRARHLGNKVGRVRYHALCGRIMSAIVTTTFPFGHHHAGAVGPLIPLVRPRCIRPQEQMRPRPAQYQSALECRHSMLITMIGNEGSGSHLAT